MSVTGLRQSYGGRTALADVSFSLADGVMGLLGPNGAGKTTLLRTLATIASPARGEVCVAGRVVRTGRDARLARRAIGYLPQDFGYLPGFSVYDFVRYVAWLREVPRGVAHDSTLRAIEGVGLSDRMSDRMRTLSGGMVRRAGIASAIVGDPKLVLLDEPTVGLDPAQRLDFRSLIRSLGARAVVLSTHLVEDVAALCDTVVVLDSGRVIFTGSTGELSALAAPDVPGDTAIERGYMTVLRAGGGRA
ncbi:ATP-binding cassette domain-containing protein [Frankia sp. AgB32]|uniref:ATP-binding cassette domain-containing protein n=1 Tax=Frankia sp. AgB32 TaxID=631119 RepID=UPI00200D7B4F|nr:ATP-binding cassette domain-containing protein [Frankia sp. AgB32]MCK9897957.1 ATP-binding cassette domain-containing protein [Frankia sp. AgB32]